LGKYGGGVKSEILNATEEKVKAEMNILQKMIFTEEEETGFENHTFEKVTNFELHNFGLITEHNLSKCRERGRGWSYLFHKIVENS